MTTGWVRGALLLLAGVLLTACTTTDGTAATPAPSTSSAATTAAPSSGVAAPAACVKSAEVTRAGIAGRPMWVRFCPGRRGYLLPAEVPSDALTTHLDLLAGLEEHGTATRVRCPVFSGRSYRLRIGYADGRVATIVGHTDPDCAGRLVGGGTVEGPATLGVYGLVMTAFGRQNADALEDFASGTPLVCPDDPLRPDTVDVDGASASLDTGYLLGERSPMIMPLPAERGILCTWPFRREDDEPVVRDLSAAEAERVRIGLHAIAGGVVDCGGSRDPTYTAVVEDRTGTRRAVTILESECSTVIRSDNEYGLGFAWLDR